MMTFRAACLSSLLLSLLPEPCSAQRENAVPDPARGYQWDQDAKRRGFDGKDVAQLARDKIIVSNQSFKQVFDAYLKTDTLLLPLVVIDKWKQQQEADERLAEQQSKMGDMRTAGAGSR